MLGDRNVIGHDTLDNSFAIAGWRFSNVASQQILGVLSERHTRARTYRRADIGAHRAHLEVATNVRELETVMMTNSGWQYDLITELQLQPLARPEQLDCEGARSVDARAAATGCIDQNAIATARATAKIADWMTYLPKDCVKAMVDNGWHWST